jgi:hypothetical protein
MKSLLARLILSLAFGATAVAAMITFRHAGIGVLAIVVLTYLCVLVLVLAILLNYPRLPHQAMVNDFADELEARNLLQCTSFRADRAFRVGEFGDRGPHYFLELEDGGGILHLCGTYLYDYEPSPDSLRHFPCTQFTVRRHAEAGYVVDVTCGGIVIEPEVEAPPYSAQEFEANHVPEDGAILHDISFEVLRLERTHPQTFIQ